MTTTKTSKKHEFVFRKSDDIGTAGAEDDNKFLKECFIDTGDLGLLLDCTSAKRIVVGRTGSGKTALLKQLESTCSTVISLSPHSLSLNYIANNNVLRFFEEAGVNLSPFYILLWKHIIVVELLKSKFDIKSQETQRRSMARLKDLLSRDNIKEQAVDYLEKWGNKFWLTTEQRMHELTNRIEESLSASLQGGLGPLKVSVDGAKNLTTEEKQQIVEHGKKAVSEVQIRELENLISILDDSVFTDKQRPFYITIDTLDEQWADDRIRFKLIKSLIDTARRFRKVKNAKIVIALRQDLLDKVLHSSVDPGFQEEKYESLYLYIRWTQKELRELVKSRLTVLIKHRYTSEEINPDDLFPDSIDKIPALDYIFSRTFLRPRDVILYINECIAHSDRRPNFTAHNVKIAEEEYSHKRLQSLATEWQIIFPNLKAIALMFYGMKASFQVSDLSETLLCEKYEQALDEIEQTKIDPMSTALDKLYEKGGNFGSIRNQLIRHLHFVGLIGIKVGPTTTPNWVYQSRLSLSPGQIKPSSRVLIHPMFFRSLGIKH